MQDNGVTPTPRQPRLGLKIALVSAGIAAGAIGATAVGASALSTPASSTSTSTSSSSTTPDGSRPPGAPAGQRPGGSAPVRSDEKAVSSTISATLRAAALKAVPGGTVHRIETDAGDGTYEAHMTKADGTLVTVKFDKNLAVTKVEDGMGTGDPAPSK